MRKTGSMISHASCQQESYCTASIVCKRKCIMLIFSLPTCPYSELCLTKFRSRFGSSVLFAPSNRYESLLRLEAAFRQGFHLSVVNLCRCV